jgi:biotin synthase
MEDIINIIEKLETTQNLTDDELLLLLSNDTVNELLYQYADKVRKEYYGTDVYLRGLIEFSNVCKNDCYYCGIRKSNPNVDRYCLTKEQILDCCEMGHELGYRTFVLQSGESFVYSDTQICDIVYSIKSKYPDCAVTLSLGEKDKQSYMDYYNAGAERYLLRHETANDTHYAKLHPHTMSLANRKQCLFNLKDIGYQVGSGFMVGSPYQTLENLVEDLRFLQTLKPDMIGIGTYITHKDTPFKDFPTGSLDLTLKLISILRLMFPYALIPSTTALGTISPIGRELGLKAGANVVMPNLSPTMVRKKYQLYDNKICTGEEAGECKGCLERRVNSVGYRIVSNRGDVLEH